MINRVRRPIPKEMNPYYTQQVSKGHGIVPVSPMNQTKNSKKQHGYNRSAKGDVFFRRLNIVKESYYKLHESKEGFQQTLKHLGETHELKEDIIKQIVGNYNRALTVLEKLDKRVGTLHSKAFEGLIEDYQPHLKHMGIAINSDGRLSMGGKVSRQFINNPKSPLNLLIWPVKNMVGKVCAFLDDVSTLNLDEHIAVGAEAYDSQFAGMVFDQYS